MAAQQAGGFKRRGFLGKLLVSLGIAILLADSAFLAGPVAELSDKMKNGLFVVLPAVGLSILHAARAVAFHQIDYFSLASRILVLFCAMGSLIVGLVVLSLNSTRSATTLPLPGSPSAQEETDNGSSR